MAWSAPSLAQTWEVTSSLNEQNERIVQAVLADGTLLADAMVIYETGGTWMLPLGELASAMDLPIQVSPTLGLAEGSLVSEEQKFRLSLAECQVRIKDEIRKLPRRDDGTCVGIIPFDQEVYIDVALLSAWLPSRFRVDGPRSQLVLTSTEELPIQARIRRQQQWERSSKGPRQQLDPGLPWRSVPREWLDGFSSDQQISVRSENAAGAGSKQDFSVSSAVNAELLGFQSFGFLSIDGNRLQRPRVSLIRREPEGLLLGPMRARSVELLDFEFPQLPMISSARIARGLLISNIALNQRHDFGRRDITGEILPGWEVQLFHNDILIDQQTADATGRYLFTAVPMYYGQNRIHLAFFGPQGQRRNEYFNYSIDSQTLQSGETEYRAAIGIRDSQATSLIELRQGISSFATIEVLNARILHPEESSGRQYYQAGLRAFGNGVLARALATFQSGGGSAKQLSVQLPLRSMAIGARYTTLQDFQSEIYNFKTSSTLASRIEGEWAFLLPTSPGIQTTWLISRDSFLDAKQTVGLTARQSLNLGRVYWNHEIRQDWGLSGSPRGRIEANYAPSFSRFSASIDYFGSSPQRANLETQTSWGDDYSLLFSAQKSLTSNEARLGPSIVRNFKSFLAGLSASADSSGDFSLGLNLSSNLSRDPRQGTAVLRAANGAENGTASVRVFVDANRNGIMDSGETPVEHVGIQLNQRDLGIFTDREGLAFIQGLAPYSPSSLALAPSSIDSPFLRPAEKGIRFIPRPGKPFLVDLPLLIVGEIEGIVEIDENGRITPVRLAVVEALSLDDGKSYTTRTGRDGVFVFEEMPPGLYRVRVREIRNMKPAQDPGTRDLSIAPGGSIENGLTFRVRAP
jgi:hypothetical protein